MNLELKTLERELVTELKMRRKVWRRLPGCDDRFVDQALQRRYDILLKLLEVVEYAPYQQWEKLVKAAESAKGVVQTSLDL